MSEIINSNAPQVFVRDGHVFANSRDVAAVFEKRHDHVLRDIDKLAADMNAISAEEGGKDRLPNFGETVTSRPNPAGGAPIQSRSYDMTRDGFTLLAMGFTGSKALRWKLRYIEAFNRMEEALRSGTVPDTEVASERDIFVSSWDVAQTFSIPHRNVLDTIARLRAPRRFIEGNFWLREHRVESGRQWETVDMTRLGFAILMLEYGDERGFEAKERMAQRYAMVLGEDTFPVGNPMAAFALREKAFYGMSLNGNGNPQSSKLTGHGAAIAHNEVTGLHTKRAAARIGKAMSSPNPTASDNLLSVRQVVAKTGISRPEIYKRMDAGKFPSKISLGPKTVRWSENEINAWIDALKKSRAA
ncbi:AlpA family phage regulatory protein [Agrobacterium vitis]|nr:Rha family transcriptional regulator [Agrobacterium vitis]MCF1498888.1 AlpA family phage regulatory protein [Allorhizobium sp. Av2]MCM2441210.1 AlpA family phage regulatory protein [Agrobacterium vitis]